MIYEALHRKLKIGQHESTKNWVDTVVIYAMGLGY
jgi:hypothetical protein